ncbi:hypothetical protein KIPB_014143 [Kipferlia bialata]|uniref:Uncharacterized protein n=1 Tax=Kipferlia bialata TaxID=797122 RepID=A0A9K3DBY3_9EUKA|nr:hypothetical protein KIPB_014143 [Kipferlia bialata]|eukprot:g14143.t1
MHYEKSLCDVCINMYIYMSVAEVAARNPRLSEQQKTQSARQIKALQKKVSVLKRCQATRQRLADKMGQYLGEYVCGSHMVSLMFSNPSTQPYPMAFPCVCLPYPHL